MEAVGLKAVGVEAVGVEAVGVAPGVRCCPSCTMACLPNCCWDALACACRSSGTKCRVHQELVLDVCMTSTKE